jgi:peptide/histidine transporter 3/4
VTQVEELKLCLRLLPIVATTLFLWTGYTQLVTLFVKQGSTMERRIGQGFEIPPASLPVFSVVNALLILPLYEKVAVPLLRRRRKQSGAGFTPLQRMGFGLAMSVGAMLAAALVEQKRRSIAVSAGLADDPSATVPMSIFWLVPQYFLVGLAEIFTYVGQLHFFYAEASPGLRSLSTSLFISELGIGSWISSILVTIVRRATGGDDDHGWITDNINRSKIDRFYWLLAALSALNFGLFLVAASRHRYRAGL